MEEEERSGSERTGVDEGKREDQERERKRESERAIHTMPEYRKRLSRRTLII